MCNKGCEPRLCRLADLENGWIRVVRPSGFARLEELISDDAERAEALTIYVELLMAALPATREVAEAAFDLRQQVLKRLTNGDALIAATAQLQGAILVHRDPHMAGIPESLARQIVLPAKAGVVSPGAA